MIRVKHFGLVILFSAITVVASAQPQPQDPPQGDPDAGAVPITGLEYLLISGGAYGVAQLMRKRKHKQDEM